MSSKDSTRKDDLKGSNQPSSASTFASNIFDSVYGSDDNNRIGGSSFDNDNLGSSSFDNDSFSSLSGLDD